MVKNDSYIKIEHDNVGFWEWVDDLIYDKFSHRIYMFYRKILHLFSYYFWCREVVWYFQRIGYALINKDPKITKGNCWSLNGYIMEKLLEGLIVFKNMERYGYSSNMTEEEFETKLDRLIYLIGGYLDEWHNETQPLWEEYHNITDSVMYEKWDGNKKNTVYSVKLKEGKTDGDLKKNLKKIKKIGEDRYNEMIDLIRDLLPDLWD